MNIKSLLKNPKIMSLSPNSFKVYLYFLTQNTEFEFTIRGAERCWKANTQLNLPTSKKTIQHIVRELEDLQLISFNKKNGTLKIHQQ